MLRIAICCGEGFSSGFLSRHLATTCVKEHLQDRATFVFFPYFELYDRQDEVDIAMLMPHVEHKLVADKREYHIPIYVIPYKVIVLPTAGDYIEDAEDIMELSGGKGGLIYFPGEEHTARISRNVSHRKFLLKKKK